MAIAFVKRTFTDTVASGTSSYIDMASGSPTEGSPLIAVVRNKSGGTQTPPGDWLPITSQITAANQGTSYYYKQAGASDPPTYRWTFQYSGYSHGEIIELSGWQYPGPIEKVAVTSGYYNGGTAPYSASITPDSDNCYILHIVTASYSVDELTISASLTELFDDKTSVIGINGGHQVAGYTQQTTAEATGVISHTLTNTVSNHFWNALVMAIVTEGEAAVVNPTITFGAGNNLPLVIFNGSANAAAVTPVTGVAYKVFYGHVTSTNSETPIQEGTDAVVDDGGCTLTITADNTLSSTDEVTVELYHASIVQPRIYHVLVD